MRESRERQQSLQNARRKLMRETRSEEAGSPSDSMRRTAIAAGLLKKALPVLVLCAAITGGFAWFAGGSGDPGPSQAELQVMEANLSLLQTTGGQVPRVAEAEREAALTSMALPDEQRQEVAQSVEAGGTELVWLTLWDNMAEDGDIVTVESDWLRVAIPILNQPTRVAVPIPFSGVVNLRATHDGGGGVTLAFVADETTLPLPPLMVGQAIGVRVAPAP